MAEDLSYFQKDEFKQLLARYEHMIQHSSPDYFESDELTDIAEYYYIKGNPQESERAIAYALKLHPRSIDPTIYLARQKMFEGDFEEAERLKAQIDDTGDREVVLFTGELHIKKGDVKKAHLYFDHFDTENPWSDAPGEFAFDVAEVFLDCEQFDEALWWNEKATSSQYNELECLTQKADIQVGQGEVDTAIDNLNKVLDEDPYSLRAWYTIADAHFQNEDWDMAIQAAQFINAINEGDERATLQIANCKFQQGEPEVAHTYYQKYLRKVKSNEVAYLFDGLTLGSLDRYEEAIEQLHKAEKLSTANAARLEIIYENLALDYSNTGQVDKAIEYSNKLNYTFNSKARIHYLQGCIYMNASDENSAALCFSLYLQLDDGPQDEAFFNVGTIYWKYMHWDAAIIHFTHAIENTTRNKLVHDCAAFISHCYLNLANTEQFLFYLTLAVPSFFLDKIYAELIPSDVEVQQYPTYVREHFDEIAKIYNLKRPEGK